MNYTEEHEQRPLPPERIDQDDEDEPIDEFGVGEEIESSSRCKRFNRARHVDPPLHPVFMRGGQGVDKEHEQKPGVDTDMHVSNSSDGVDVGTVDGTDTRL